MLISAKGLKFKYDYQEILNNVYFEVYKNDMIVNVGKNGLCKTKIFRIITKQNEIDGGIISIKRDCKIGVLDQIPEYDLSVYEVITLEFKEIKKIREELRMMESSGDIELNISKYYKLQEEFEKNSGYEFEYLVKKISVGVGVEESMLHRSFNSLSGGEKSRVVLAKILLEQPDVLLLDEPTNHLDINAIKWLEKYLQNYKGTIIVISHDRYLLDQVVNKIYDVEFGKIKEYKGNYSSYVIQKKAYIEQLEKEYKNQEKKIKKMEEAISRFKLWRQMSDDQQFAIKARNMEKRIEKMDKVEKVNSGKKVNLQFKGEKNLGQYAIIVEDLKFGYEELLFENTNFDVRSQDHVVLVGDNGAGKTTLFNLMMNGHDSVKLNEKVKLGMLNQNIIYSNPSLSVVEEFRNHIPVDEGEARNKLANFLFFGDTVFNKLSTLSGGEKTRLELAKLMYGESNVLLLDEPTNHLDIETKEILEDVIISHEGILMIISHDRYFINKVAHYIFEVYNKEVRKFNGNYDYYLKAIENRDEVVKVRKSRQVKLNSRQSRNDFLLEEIEKLNNKILEEELKSNVDEEYILALLEKVSRYENEYLLEKEGE